MIEMDVDTALGILEVMGSDCDPVYLGLRCKHCGGGISKELHAYELRGDHGIRKGVKGGDGASGISLTFHTAKNCLVDGTLEDMVKDRLEIT